MCGNGSRCVARFAYLKGIAGPEMVFLTKAGPIRASVSKRRVKVLMPKPWGLKMGLSLLKDGAEISMDFINTGVPHSVIITEGLEDLPVESLGRHIRFHNLFSPQGTNVNFVKVLDKNQIMVRTYERGVEGETLACGTGSVASALITSLRGMTDSPVSVITRGGEVLKVYFALQGNEIAEVFLEGDTTLVCKGFLFEEAFDQDLTLSQRQKGGADV
ncbi:MAG: diaminopimelate epimerase, partial [Desulfatiglandales bacterium]